MPQLMLSFSKIFIILMLITSCSLPRGAALQSEILSNANKENPDVAVYQVTKSFLPVMANWPKTGLIQTTSWPSHGHTGNSSLITPGDIVNLTIWDSEENSLLTTPTQKVIPIENVKVSSNGTIFVPYLDKVEIAGMTDEDARSTIQSRMESIIPSAQVQLSSVAGTNRSVSIVGGVSNPGHYPIPDPHFTLLNLISLGGGVSTNIRNPRVQLIRAGRTYTASFDHILTNPAGDTILRGGDKVIVKDDKRYFRSLGAASNEQLIYFEEDNISALDAMSLIGGLTDNRANPKGILILREYSKNDVRYNGTGPKNENSVFVIDLTSSDGLFSAGRFAINSQDTVLVTESPISPINTVFGLIGTVFGIANKTD